MLKFYFSCVLVISSLNALCQEYGIIDDIDGYVNIRQTPALDSKIIGRIFENDVFFFSKVENSDWYAVQYGGQIPKLISEMAVHQRDYYLNDLKWKSNSVEIEGYVHKTRVIALSNLLKLNPEASQSTEAFAFKNDTLSFELKIGKFDKANHKIEKGKNGLEIDGQTPFGLQEEFPKHEIRSLRLVIHSKEITIPTSDLKDLYEFDLGSLNLSVDRKGVLYIHGFGSDGYTGYSVIWIIRPGKYLKREIGTS